MRWKNGLFTGPGIALICSLFIYSKSTLAQDKPVRTIVIDAGHGGKDVGARGSYSNEKDVSLAVALKLGKYLEETLPDVKIVYTRKTDVFDDVRAKAKIANDAHGDLFVSIHCNAAADLSRITGYKTVTVKKGKKRVTRKVPIYKKYPNPAKGTETYIWATSKNNAKTESLRNNSVVVFDANSEETKQLMDTNDPETLIMLNTMRNVFFDQSLRLSTLVEEEFTNVGRISRGARQRNEKGILVLHATAMPSVLVELGFISNPEEEDYLNSADGQNEMAGCIGRAVKRYKDELERASNSSESSYNSRPPAQPVQQPVQQIPASTKTTNTAAAKTVTEYKVQLLTSEKLYATNAPLFKPLKGTVKREELKQGKKKMHKYTWGSFRSASEAQSALQKARKQGFKDAFLVTYQNGERVNLQM